MPQYQHTSRSPARAEFVDYATSWGAENLLSVSYQWWHDADAIKVHYERLVRDPLKGFDKLVTELQQPCDKVPMAVQANPLTVLRDTPNRHGW